jgi:hypothetical protein
MLPSQGQQRLNRNHQSLRNLTSAIIPHNLQTANSGIRLSRILDGIYCEVV